MSISGIDDLQLRMEKKESVIDTTKQSEIKIYDEKTNGYNEIKTFEKNPSEYMNKPADDIHELKGKFVKCTGTAFDGNFRIIAEKERNPFDVARKRNIKAFEKGKISLNMSKDVSMSIDEHLRANRNKLGEDAEKKLTSVSMGITDMKDMFGETIPMPRKDKFGDVTERTKQEAKMQIDRDCKDIDKLYAKLIGDIDKVLLNNHGELDGADELRKALTDLKKQCEIEKNSFKDRIYQYADDMLNNPKKRKAHAKWSDALEYARESNKALGQDMIDYKMVEKFNTRPSGVRKGAGGAKGDSKNTRNTTVSNSI
ncbi:MAG: hypothetical protein K6E91_01495 [Butyrivibrio sp.]|nr:hypothetical protein [Butyrivibrio sp.]